EGFAVDGSQLQNKPGWLVVGTLKHDHPLDPRGTREVDDHSRPPLHDQAIAKCLDQSPAGFAGFRRELKGDLRHVDDDPERIGERKHAKIYLATKIYN